MSDTITTENNAVVAVDDEMKTAPAESVISEQQEQVLQTVEPVSEPNSRYSEIEAAWEDGQYTDADLLNFVRNGEMTEDQLVELRGQTVAELEAAANEPEEKPELFSFDVAKEAVFKQIRSGQLDNAGAIGLVRAMKNRNEISIETHDMLLQMLKAEDDDKVSDGQNDIDQGNKIALEISSHYKPSKTFDEATTEAKDIVSDKIRSDVEFEGSKASRLLFDLADICVALIDRPEDGSKGKVLKITFGTTPVQVTNDAGQVITKNMRRCTAHRELWKIIRDEELLGKAERPEQKVGKMTRDLGATFDPYNDPAIRPIIERLCQTALLLAYGHISKVTLGYMPKTRKRPSRGQVFQAEVEDESKFWRFPCLPENILRPRKYGIEIVEQKSTTESGTTTTKYINRAIDKGENDSDLLMWLPPEVVDPYFQHCFADHELAYETEAKGTSEGGGVFPSGVIIRSFDPKIGDTKGRQRGNKVNQADQLQKAREQINKLTAENAVLVDAAKGELSLDNRTKTLQALVALTANPRMDLANTDLCYELELAYTAVEKRLRNGNRPSPEALKYAAKLYQALANILKDNEDGTFDYTGKDGLRIKIAA